LELSVFERIWRALLEFPKFLLFNSLSIDNYNNNNNYTITTVTQNYKERKERGLVQFIAIEGIDKMAKGIY